MNRPRETVEKACHCEEAQRADVAIRFQNSRVSAHFRLLGYGFPRRFAPRNDRKGFIDTLYQRS